MPNPIVILHGWNDDSKSFGPLASWLGGQGFDVASVHLSDYLSMNDEISLPDLGNALNRALETKGVAQGPHAFDVIVHSTGGLVIREYLRQMCAGNPALSPVQRLLMFSPANFGSPLAAKGKTMVGRLLDGWNSQHFMQTGTLVLDALELASPYGWELAMSDLFNAVNPVLQPQYVQTTVMAGTAAYPDFRAALHENGSDGTVFVATAGLNLALLRVDCDTDMPTFELVENNVRQKLALAVFDRDHSAIHDPADTRQTAEWKTTVLDALRIDPPNYAAHVGRCDALAQATFAAPHPDHPDRYHQYQILVVRVNDQFGQPVPDYVLEFYQEANDAADDVFTAIHTDILTEVTRNSTAGSYRSFLFDITGLQSYLVQNPNAEIEMSITAARVSERIGYRNPARGVPIFTGRGRNLLRPNTALFVEITLYRDPIDAVFVLQ